MALSNFILTVAGVTAAVMILRYDLKKSATTFRRNIRHIRHWLEEESSAPSKTAEKVSPKELETHIPKEERPKEEKH